MTGVRIRSDRNFHWLIADDVDTTAKTSNEHTYDRHVYSRDLDSWNSREWLLDAIKCNDMILIKRQMNWLNVSHRIVVYGDDMLAAVLPNSAKPFNFQKEYGMTEEMVRFLLGSKKMLVKRTSTLMPCEVWRRLFPRRPWELATTTLLKSNCAKSCRSGWEELLRDVTRSTPRTHQSAELSQVRNKNIIHSVTEIDNWHINAGQLFFELSQQRFSVHKSRGIITYVEWLELGRSFMSAHFLLNLKACVTQTTCLCAFLPHMVTEELHLDILKLQKENLELEQEKLRLQVSLLKQHLLKFQRENWLVTKQNCSGVIPLCYYNKMAKWLTPTTMSVSSRLLYLYGEKKTFNKAACLSVTRGGQQIQLRPLQRRRSHLTITISRFESPTCRGVIGWSVCAHFEYAAGQGATTVKQS